MSLRKTRPTIELILSHLLHHLTSLSLPFRAFTRILCSCCPRRCRKRYQTRWKGGIAQIIVTPVVSTLNTSFMKAGQRPYPPGPYSPVAPALATALVAATSPPSSSS
nr:uncharacterized protein LOC113826000 [Penaeus vannamei]